MRYATQLDLSEIYAHFQTRRDVFPHIRKDSLAEFIAAGGCVYQDGVILTFHRNIVSAPVIQRSIYKAPTAL